MGLGGCGAQGGFWGLGDGVGGLWTVGKALGVWDWGLGAVGDRESLGGLVMGFRGSFRHIPVLWAWKYPLKTAILGAEYRCKELLFIGEVRWASWPVRIFFSSPDHPGVRTQVSPPLPTSAAVEKRKP